MLFTSIESPVPFNFLLSHSKYLSSWMKKIRCAHIHLSMFCLFIKSDMLRTTVKILKTQCFPKLVGFGLFIITESILYLHEFLLSNETFLSCGYPSVKKKTVVSKIKTIELNKPKLFLYFFYYSLHWKCSETVPVSASCSLRIKLTSLQAKTYEDTILIL